MRTVQSSTCKIWITIPNCKQPKISIMMSPENSNYIKEVDNATYFSGNPRILIARDKTVQGFFNSSSINHQHQLQEIQNISLEIADKELKDISFEQS